MLEVGGTGRAICVLKRRLGLFVFYVQILILRYLSIKTSDIFKFIKLRTMVDSLVLFVETLTHVRF